MADEALDDARYLLQGGRTKAAANRAYYAMFHAVQAALASVGVRAPKTHGGAINLFGRHYVRAGRIDRRIARDLQDVYDLRQRSDYEVYVQVGEDTAKEATGKAESFVAEVKRLLVNAGGAD